MDRREHPVTADRPPLHLAVANGFPPETYTPLIDALNTRTAVFCLPPRPLWTPPPDPGTLTQWRDLADDLLRLLADRGDQPVIAVGHSLGGVVSLIAALKQPQRFRALILLDPVILPPPAMRLMRRMQAAGQMEAFPLVQGALRRRARFAAPEEAFAYWRTRPLFADWSDDALRRYVAAGLVPDPDGDGWTLRWSAAWEARVFATGHIGSWRDLKRLNRLTPPLPALLVRGATSDTLLEACAARIAARCPQIAVRTLDGHGHLFPLSAPEATARLILGWLAEHGLIGA
ncbi:MAG: alpha/beta fold hydrolase [Candidatus Flexifilum sp.]